MNEPHWSTNRELRKQKVSDIRGWLLLAMLVVFVGGLAWSGIAALIDGGDDTSRTVSRVDFGDEWPLTVDEGTLRCEPGKAVTFTTGGVTYAVNGTAVGRGDWPDIDRLWAAPPTTLFPEQRIDISPLIRAGLDLCD